MKKMIYVFVTLLMTTISYAQLNHDLYDEIPSIYLVNEIENDAYGNDRKKLAEFYIAWENNTLDNSDRNKYLKHRLENDVVAFISKGWLYVVSYEPKNDKSYERYVYLYKKFVADNNSNHEWMKACEQYLYYVGCNPNISPDGYSFSIKFEKDETYNERVVKTNDGNNIFLLLDIEMTKNRKQSFFKRLYVFESTIVNNDLKYDYFSPESEGMSDCFKSFKRENNDYLKYNKESFTIKAIGIDNAEHLIKIESSIIRKKSWIVSMFIDNNQFRKLDINQLRKLND